MHDIRKSLSCKIGNRLHSIVSTRVCESRTHNLDSGPQHTQTAQPKTTVAGSVATRDRIVSTRT
ncbi:hypothetical protein Hanom_Chr10g00901291 [Helianthus anomalus]